MIRYDRRSLIKDIRHLQHKYRLDYLTVFYIEDDKKYIESMMIVCKKDVSVRGLSF